jgi:hypothetical protein
MRDVVQGIGREDEKIRGRTGLEHAKGIRPERPRCIAGRCQECSFVAQSGCDQEL